MLSQESDKEELKDSMEGICCICGHKLHNHLNERDKWRCHSIGHDFYQCECRISFDECITCRGTGNLGFECDGTDIVCYNCNGIGFLESKLVEYDYIIRKIHYLEEEGVDLTSEENLNLFFTEKEKEYYEVIYLDKD